jgi:hypothetical protein
MTEREWKDKLKRKRLRVGQCMTVPASDADRVRQAARRLGFILKGSRDGQNYQFKVTEALR